MVVNDGKVVGIVTERHYARNVVLKGKTSPVTPVEDIMETASSRRGRTHRRGLHGTDDDNRVRHLPVLEGKELVGIVSIGDLVKSIIGEQKFVIEQLEHYIHG